MRIHAVIFPAICLIAITVDAAAQTTYYVAPCGDDTWTGTDDACAAPNGPKQTIQAAITVAVDGDEVIVADGTYTGEGNVDLDFGGRLIALRSGSGHPDACVIDCQDSARGFSFHTGETADAVVEGLTVTNGTGGVPRGGGALRIDASSPTIRNCVFRENRSTYFGGAIHVFSGSPLILNCRIVGNSAESFFTAPGRGGGIHNGGNATVVNCLIADNDADNPVEGSFGGGIHNDGSLTLIGCTITGNVALDGDGIENSSATLVARNCIVWGNGDEDLRSFNGDVDVTYSDIPWAGAGNIDADPLFVDPALGDFRLPPGSPCIDRGNNSAVPAEHAGDLDGHPRFVDDPDVADTGIGACSIADLGAYERQSGTTCCSADLNGDGLVGFDDLLTLLNSWGDCAGCDADLDGDDAVAFGDLLVLLSAWGPCV